MELDEKDKKILACLDSLDRASLSKIARISRLTKKQVYYRVEKLIKNDIIRGFVPRYDYAKLGYPVYVVILLKFEKYKDADIYLMENKKIENLAISYGKLIGKYDIFQNLFFENENELNIFLAYILEKYTIVDYLVIRPYLFEKYPRKFLWDKIRKDKRIIHIGSNAKKIKLDKNEKEILKILDKNVREKVINIAKKLNISAELAYYKVKKIYSEMIILGDMLMLNMEKLGFYYSGILLNLNNFSKGNQEKIREFATNNPYIDSLFFSISKPNCYIQLFHKNEKELRDTIKELKERFKDQRIDLELMSFFDIKNLNYLLPLD